MFARRKLKKMSLLLDRSKLRIALVNDQVHQAVAYPLIGNVEHLLPFRPALERAEFDFVRPNRPKFRLELVLLDFGVVHSDLLSPGPEQIYPVVKRCDSCCRHWPNLLTGIARLQRRIETTSLLLRLPRHFSEPTARFAQFPIRFSTAASFLK